VNQKIPNQKLEKLWKILSQKNKNISYAQRSQLNNRSRQNNSMKSVCMWTWLWQ